MRRAVVVLMLVAVVSGLVFNAFTLPLPQLIEERLGSDPRLLLLVGLAAFAAMLCGAATQFTVGRLIDWTLRRVYRRGGRGPRWRRSGSLALAFLDRACRNLVSAFPQLDLPRFRGEMRAWDQALWL